MLIGVTGDTHMYKRAAALPGALLEGLAGVDLILHTGDLTDPQVLSDLEKLAPVVAVQGNNDPPDLLPVVRIIPVGSWQIGMAHGHVGKGQTTLQRALSHFTDVDCVVFGHSHQPYCEWHDGVLAFNPGSPTDRRRAPRFSFGLLRVDKNGISGEIIAFDKE